MDGCAKHMQKGKSKSLVGCPAPPMGIMEHPGHARALPGISQRPPRALQRPSWSSQNLHEQVTSQQSQSSSDQPAVTSHRKQASDVPGSKKGVRRQEAEGP